MHKPVQAFGRTVFLRPGTTDEAVFQDTFVGRHHVPAEPIAPRTILDLGCNIGLTMLDYAYLWPAAKIVGVELDAANAELARQNSGLPVITAAVAAHSGTGQYDSTAEEWTYRLCDKGDRSVQTITLSELASSLGSVDFVKMDIEGTEFEVLQAIGWEQYVGSILVEVHDGRCTEMLELLESRGFTAKLHTAHWSAVWARKRLHNNHTI